MQPMYKSARAPEILTSFCTVFIAVYFGCHMPVFGRDISAPEGAKITTSFQGETTNKQQLSFKCAWNNTAFPTPNVTWNGISCNKSKDDAVCNVFVDLFADNEKTFSCTAYNSAGSSSANYTLRLKPKDTKQPQIMRMEVNGQTDPKICVSPESSLSIRCVVGDTSSAVRTAGLLRVSRAEGSCASEDGIGAVDTGADLTCHWTYDYYASQFDGNCARVQATLRGNQKYDLEYIAPAPSRCDILEQYFCQVSNGSSFIDLRRIRVALNCTGWEGPLAQHDAESAGSVLLPVSRAAVVAVSSIASTAFFLLMAMLISTF